MEIVSPAFFYKWYHVFEWYEKMGIKSKLAAHNYTCSIYMFLICNILGLIVATKCDTLYMSMGEWILHQSIGGDSKFFLETVFGDVLNFSL